MKIIQWKICNVSSTLNWLWKKKLQRNYWNGSLLLTSGGMSRACNYSRAGRDDCRETSNEGVAQCVWLSE